MELGVLPTALSFREPGEAEIVPEVGVAPDGAQGEAEKVPEVGLEPESLGFTIRCSAVVLSGRGPGLKIAVVKRCLRAFKTTPIFRGLSSACCGESAAEAGRS